MLVDYFSVLTVPWADTLPFVHTAFFLCARYTPFFFQSCGGGGPGSCFVRACAAPPLLLLDFLAHTVSPHRNRRRHRYPGPEEARGTSHTAIYRRTQARTHHTGQAADLFSPWKL